MKRGWSVLRWGASISKYGVIGVCAQVPNCRTNASLCLH